MDWIEQLWGIAPDGGSGALEGLILAVILLAVWTRWRVRRDELSGRD
jgi:hypothetical protein